MRFTRILTVAAVAAALAAMPSVARAGEPLRSGTIVSGVGESPVTFGVRGMEGCVGAPTCSAWLQSECSPALAGVDPALHASIVDVGALSDGRTLRSLKARTAVAGINWGSVIVQFWTETGVDSGGWPYPCREIMGSRVTWRSPCFRWGFGDSCSFKIPASAKWMTITSSPDNTNLAWTLE
ncbi:MAG TPA: hypothetical protein VM030_10270 [Acidimicrobiales bacterium]|nr:hypothetical protein [Acidimicrobiales bacterium]